MKTLSLVLLVLLVAVGSAYALSPSDGYKTTGILGPNAHVHVKTTPIKVFQITVIPTANGGYADIIETNNCVQDNAYSSVGSAGVGYVSGRETSVKADIQSATANATVTAVYPEGININEQTFVNTVSAFVQIYYKE